MTPSITSFLSLFLLSPISLRLLRVGVCVCVMIVLSPFLHGAPRFTQAWFGIMGFHDRLRNYNQGDPLHESIENAFLFFFFSNET